MTPKNADPEEVQKKAIEAFKDESDNVDKERMLATKEWLMNTAKETINITLRGRKIRIRKRLTAEENKRIPKLYPILGKSPTYKLSPEEEKASEKEYHIFLSMVMVDPEIEADDVNNTLTTIERHWITKKYLEARNFDLLENMSDIPFFRPDGRGTSNAGTGNQKGTKPRGTRKAKAK